MAGFAEVMVRMSTAEEGGRSSPIWFGKDAPNKYRPHFRVLGGNGEMLGIEFIDGPDGQVIPGKTTVAAIRFLYEPSVSYDELRVGATFDILEGPKVVGAGEVIRR